MYFFSFSIIHAYSRKHFLFFFRIIRRSIAMHFDPSLRRLSVPERIRAIVSAMFETGPDRKSRSVEVRARVVGSQGGFSSIKSSRKILLEHWPDTGTGKSLDDTSFDILQKRVFLLDAIHFNSIRIGGDSKRNIREVFCDRNRFTI